MDATSQEGQKGTVTTAAEEASEVGGDCTTEDCHTGGHCIFTSSAQGT